MKFSDIDRNIRNGIIVFTVSGILIVLFSVVISHLDLIFGLIGSALDVLMPFLVGILFAVILQPLRTLAEEKWLKNLKCKDRTRRKLATDVVFFELLCRAYSTTHCQHSELSGKHGWVFPFIEQSD